MERDAWARARAALAEGGPGNAEALDDIDSAIFAVCLEDKCAAAAAAARPPRLPRSSPHPPFSDSSSSTHPDG